MMDKVVKMTMGLGLMALAAQQLRAEGRADCAPHDTVVQRLASGYGETRQSIGLGAQGALIELYASTETGTWTITATAPGGLTCLMAAGDSFATLAKAPPRPGQGA